MKIKAIVLNRVIKWFVDGELFDFVQRLVETINREDISGKEKSEKVAEQAKKFFIDAGTFAINVCIEVAVIIMKAKAGELDAK